MVWAYAELSVKHSGLFRNMGNSIGVLDYYSRFDPTRNLSILHVAETDVDVPVAFGTLSERWCVWLVEKSNTGLPEIYLLGRSNARFDF